MLQMMHESRRVRTRCFRAVDLAQCRNQAREDAVLKEEEMRLYVEILEAEWQRRGSTTEVSRQAAELNSSVPLRQFVLTGT